MSPPLLTIIVPTYNRADNLALLLETLRSELTGLGSQVLVLVSDNCSTDRTSEVIAAISQDWDALMVQRHPTNMGPDGNFFSCVARVITRYFWIIGDDDCPKRGVIAQMVNLLLERQPALVYMQSEWLNPILSPDQGEPIGKLQITDLDARAFAEIVHVWLTFISGVVIDRVRLESALQDQPIDRFNATSLVQLGWVLPILKTTGPFLYINDRCILATSGNTGGYKVLTTFCVNFPQIIRESFTDNHPLCKIIINRYIQSYLPGLIWQVRFSRIGQFKDEESWDSVKKQLGYKMRFWLIIAPIMKLPKQFAYPFYIIARLFNRLLKICEARLLIRHQK